jgi:hypothetical protein
LLPPSASQPTPGVPPTASAAPDDGDDDADVPGLLSRDDDPEDDEDDEESPDPTPQTQNPPSQETILEEPAPAAADTPVDADPPPVDEEAPTDPITPDPGADLPGYTASRADTLLDSVYGDHPHANDGCHLDGSIASDRHWQRRWLRMAQISPTHYDVPKGRVGRRFLATLTREFRGVRERSWNSERPLVFISVILQTKKGVRRAKDIRAWLTNRMDLWDQGFQAALVDDTEAEASGRPAPARVPDEET